MQYVKLSLAILAGEILKVSIRLIPYWRLIQGRDPPWNGIMVLININPLYFFLLLFFFLTRLSRRSESGKRAISSSRALSRVAMHAASRSLSQDGEVRRRTVLIIPFHPPASAAAATISGHIDFNF
jgi:hypothetical protein